MDILADTIVAVSTPIGVGPVGIVRISGKDSIAVLKKIFKINKDINDIQSHTITYGHICHEGITIDEVLVSIMCAPKTYTKEDIVEINCHGGIKSIELVLQAVLKCGVRLAMPGEFTKRAFLNGRIDLTQAESVIDLINSKNNASHTLALNMLKGKLSMAINSMRDKILAVIAVIEASIDYPDDVEALDTEVLKVNTREIITEIERILDSAEKGDILKTGIDTAIIGRPNVGKSSLLNAILGEDRAIVTDIAGTTRDIIKDSVNIKGLPLNLIDTAGIRNTEDTIEKIGVEKSKNSAKTADLVLVVLDGSVDICNEDIEILQSFERNKIIVVNKSDLGLVLDIDGLKKYTDNIVLISAKENSGLESLYEAIKNIYFHEDININEEFVMANMRHKESLQNTLTSLNNVLDSIEGGFAEDFIAIDLHDAYANLSHIVGESLTEDIIDKIFSEFCLGK